MSRNRERVIEIVENSFSQSEKIPPEGMLFSYRGILYPAILSSPETLEALKSFETRSEDVILAGYPKTGECFFLDKQSSTQCCNPEVCAII